MFNQNKQVNTIKIHPSSITSALRLLNPPNQLQDDTITNRAKAKAIQRPRTTQVLPKWHPSVVLKAFFKPLFTNNGSDKIPLDLFTFKTAFLVSLESAARGSDLVALSWANHNITFSSDYSGARHVSIKMVPKFMPKNARLNTIPNPISFPGIAHLFPRKPEQLLCPVRVLGLYINRTQTLADQAGSDCLFVHFKPDTQVFTSHCRLWVSEAIQQACDIAPEEEKPQQIEAHEVKARTVSISYYMIPQDGNLKSSRMVVEQSFFPPLSARNCHGPGAKRASLGGSGASLCSVKVCPKLATTVHGKQVNQTWEFPLKLDQDFLSHIQWFTYSRITNRVPLQNTEPDQFFFMDAWKDGEPAGKTHTSRDHGLLSTRGSI